MKIIHLYIVFGLCFSFIGQIHTQQYKPNIILIVADDLGINALGCYGNELVESPNIDQMARNGIRFTNGYSNDPTCSPSRASIMTGQYVSRHHVYRVTDRYKKQPETRAAMKYLPPDINRVDGKGAGLGLEKVTIAEALKANGYATGGFGKWSLGRKTLSMQAHGFDEAIETTGHNVIKAYPEQNDILKNEYNADFTTRKGIEFIKKNVDQRKPFFLYMPYYLVHKPLEPKEHHFEHFKNKYGDKYDIETYKILAMIKSLDESVGELNNTVSELGIEKETIIIFVSDNGHYNTEDEIFNQPYRGYKGQTFEGGIRVPYIFKWSDKFQSNQISKEPIIHMDLFPTILGLTSTTLDSEQPIDGEDLSPLLLGERNESQRRALVWQYTNYTRYNSKNDHWKSKWVNVIQSEGFKMTEDVETNTFTLYNLNKDPYETEEVYGKYPEIESKLLRELRSWKKRTHAERPRLNPDFDDYKYPFREENLIPWSIVAFDVKERNFKERIEMIKHLGYGQYAYGGRPEHFETMEEEISLAQKEGIKISAVWLYINLSKDKPGLLRESGEKIFQSIEQTGLKTQIWVGMDPKFFTNLEDSTAFKSAIEMVAYLAERAESLGCKLALYNHGGWFGKPENQIRIIEQLEDKEIGVILNFHHAHDDLDNYEENLNRLFPYLWCVSLNGMRAEGPKIITIGKGELEKSMIEKIIGMGYDGPYAVLGHVKGGDPAAILTENKNGLRELFPKSN